VKTIAGRAWFSAKTCCQVPEPTIQSEDRTRRASSCSVGFFSSGNKVSRRYSVHWNFPSRMFHKSEAIEADHSRSNKFVNSIQFIDVEHDAIKGRHLIENPEDRGTGPFAPGGNPIASGDPEIPRLQLARSCFHEKTFARPGGSDEQWEKTQFDFGQRPLAGEK